MRKFYVEVRVHKPDSVVVKYEPTRDWIHSLQVARDMAVAMFYDDPMTQRVFHNGRFTYANRNDLGDVVTIRPVVECMGDEARTVMVKPKLKQAA
jgi:hypothetical protein